MYVVCAFSFSKVAIHDSNVVAMVLALKKPSLMSACACTYKCVAYKTVQVQRRRKKKLQMCALSTRGKNWPRARTGKIVKL